jgi:hypothetical protein
MHHTAGPWVYFKGIETGRVPGGKVYYFIFAKGSIYGLCIITAFRVLGVLSVIVCAFLVAGALFLLWLRISNWNDEDVQNYRQNPKAIWAGLGATPLCFGAMLYTVDSGAL